MKKILLSFVGSNDAGRMERDNEGAIYYATRNAKFDHLILIWNNNKTGSISYKDVATRLKTMVMHEKLVKSAVTVEIQLDDITDHNEVYIKLKAITDTIQKDKSSEYYASISSGTPAMQVAWILLAESQDFSEDHTLNLFKVTDPKFGKSKNIPVKLSTTLPKIQKLKNEIRNLLPTLTLNVSHGVVQIGKIQLPLSPVEFCYYRYFLEKRAAGIESVKFSGLTTPDEFLRAVYSYHKESFPVLDVAREEMRKMIKNGIGLSAATFRGNVSKLNKKIDLTLQDSPAAEYCKIQSLGMRGARFYGISLPPERITITD